MKKIKYLITAFLILCCTIAIGEIFQIYINNYNYFYATSFYVQEDVAFDVMLDDINKSAEKNDISVFIADNTVETTYSSTISIYGDKASLEYLDNQRDIRPGTYKSLFSGTTKIEFNDFFDVPEEGFDEKIMCYMIGDFKNIESFKNELIDTYGGSFPKIETSNSYKEAKIAVLCLWALLLLISLFLTHYDCLMQKKEAVIRISLGERKSNIVLNNIFLDTLVNIVIFVLSLLLVDSLSIANFCLDISIAMFVVTQVLNAFMYLPLLTFSIKKGLSSDVNSKKLLSLNYGLKAISAMLVVTVITGNISVIYDCLNFYRQRDFFEEHSEYSYIEFKSTKDDVSPYNEMFYKTYLSDSNMLMVDENIDLSNTTAITANAGMINYLIEEIPELKDYEFSENIYIIIPEFLQLDDSDISMLESVAENYSIDPLKRPIKVYYETESEIIAMNNYSDNRSSWVKNPIIILSNFNFYPELTENEMFEYTEIGVFSMPLRFNHLLCNIEDSVLFEFAEEYGFEYTKENSLDFFKYRCNVLSRSLWLNLVLLVVVIILEISVTSSITKLEYTVNALELSLKKIFGESIISRHRKILITNLFSTIIGLVPAYLLNVFVLSNNVKFVIISGIIVLILEFVSSLFFAIRQERKQIVKILKGGSL